jgi:hypothetical protein
VLHRLQVDHSISNHYNTSVSGHSLTIQPLLICEFNDWVLHQLLSAVVIPKRFATWSGTHGLVLADTIPTVPFENKTWHNTTGFTWDNNSRTVE